MIPTTELKSAITLETSHMGTTVLLGSEQIGYIEAYPAWGVDRLDSLPEGTQLSDEVYVTCGKVFKDVATAAAAVTAHYLLNGSVDFPEYI